MAKNNLFLGFGKGKIGDLVLYRQGGEQITRSYNPSPRNPQTTIQLLQRVLLKTCSSAYSFMQSVCNHSWQGYAEGTECQSMFMKRNIAMLRGWLHSLIEANDPTQMLLSTEKSFAGKATAGAVFNHYQVSEGTLPSVDYTMSGATGVWGLTRPDGVTGSGSSWTYQQFVDYFGLQAGDQLTFMWIWEDDEDHETMSTFKKARVILSPDDGDMSKPFIASLSDISNPNSRNEGVIRLEVSNGEVSFSDQAYVPQQQYQGTPPFATAVIVSRLVGNRWFRSTQQLYTDTISALPRNTLGAAIQSYMTVARSSLYLNQAY